MIKKSNKYSYIRGKQLTDPGTGTRVYEISNYRLPSVTTVLGATKNQDFIKKWKAKVGDKRQIESKTILVIGGHVCTNSWSTMSLGLTSLILQGLDKRRVPWPTKLLRLVLRQWKSIMVLKLRYTTRVCTQAQQILYAHTMAWRLLLTSNKVTVRSGKNGLKIITCKLQHTPWPTIMSTVVRSNRELSWYARLTYITKSLRLKDLH